MSSILAPIPTSPQRIRLKRPPTRPQAEFFASAAKFRGYVGGIGSGKTRAGCAEVLRMPAGSRGVVAAPTFPMLRDETMRTFLILARRAGLLAPNGWRASEARALLVDGKEVLFRSADNPDTLRGPNLGWFWLDEAAFMPESVWLIMIGRLRRAPGRAWVTTTPDGIDNWLAERFTAKHPDYAIIRSRTRDNIYLPEDYVRSLEESYSADYAAQELGGEFVDLTGAGLFLSERIVLVDSIPDGLPAARAWDLAATKGGGDFTAGVRLEGPDADDLWYVTDMRRGQWDTAERDGIIRQTAEADGREVQIGIPAEPGQAGKGQGLALEKLLTGYRVQSVPTTGKKIVRAGPLSSKVNAGKVRCRRAPWARALLEELRSFPKGAHDDQVDASADAFGMLATPRGSATVGGLSQPPRRSSNLFPKPALTFRR